MKYWKRTAAWFMVLCILLVSAACGQSSSKPETDTKAEADAEEPSAETPMTEAGMPTHHAQEQKRRQRLREQKRLQKPRQPERRQ